MLWGRESCTFRGKKDGLEEWKNGDTIRIWSNDATDMLIELWSEETIQFVLKKIVKP